MSRRVIICLECGREALHYARGLCGRCYSSRRRAGTLDEFPTQPWGLGLTVGDTCRRGHLITSKGDLAVSHPTLAAEGRGGLICRRCRRENQALHDLKRGRTRTVHPCPRCGVDWPVAGLCRDCRGVA